MWSIPPIGIIKPHSTLYGLIQRDRIQRQQLVYVQLLSLVANEMRRCDKDKLIYDDSMSILTFRENIIGWYILYRSDLDCRGPFY